MEVSAQIVWLIIKKIDSGADLGSSRVGKCGQKPKTAPKPVKQTMNLALKHIRTSCMNISAQLHEQHISLPRRRVNQRALETILKAILT